MKKPIVLFLNLVSLFYNKPALCASIRYAVCEDNSTFQISLHGGEEKKSSCEWLQTQQAQIRDELCKDVEVRTHCSHSCGSCCWDDKTFRFQMESGKLRSCFWLSKSSNRILKYCSTNEHIRQRCRKACGICGGSTTNLSFSQQGIITTNHVNMQHSHTSVEMESSSNLQSSKTRNKDLANDLRQSPSEIQNNDQDKGQGSGLFAIFLSMIIFSVIFGVFFSKRIGQNVVTFKNVIISKDETEKVSIIMKTLWEGKMKPQREH